MSSLTVYHQTNPDVPNKVLTHLEDIAATLAEVGVRFERWQASAPKSGRCCWRSRRASSPPSRARPAATAATAARRKLTFRRCCVF